MSNVRESRVPRKFRSMKSALVVLAAAAVLVSACGSGTKSSSESSSSAGASETTAAAVAGAQENAVTSAAVCYSWPNGTTDAQPCAVGLKGPGGGRVFYDAGSVQSWGRFLEVAPQNWNGTLTSCRPACGAADGVSTETSDVRAYLCRDSGTRLLLPGEAADTAWAIGGGKHNTEVLSKTPECVDGTTSALTLATGYRGQGLSDWYLPSGGELTELCKYTGRNAIGGFMSAPYLSSTVGPKEGYTVPFKVLLYGDPLCERSEDTTSEYKQGYVRPIRAFS